MAHDKERVFPSKQIVEILNKWIPDFDDEEKMNFILEDIAELVKMNQRKTTDRRDISRKTADRRAK